MGVRTKTIKNAAKLVIEKYYSIMTTDFDWNKLLMKIVTVCENKSVRNKITGYVTHLMKRLEKGQRIKRLTLKAQDEAIRIKSWNKPEPETPTVDMENIVVDPCSMEMLKAIGMEDAADHVDTETWRTNPVTAPERCFLPKPSHLGRVPPKWWLIDQLKKMQQRSQIVKDWDEKPGQAFGSSGSDTDEVPEVPNPEGLHMLNRGSQVKAAAAGKDEGGPQQIVGPIWNAEDGEPPEPEKEFVDPRYTTTTPPEKAKEEDSYEAWRKEGWGDIHPTYEDILGPGCKFHDQGRMGFDMPSGASFYGIDAMMERSRDLTLDDLEERERKRMEMQQPQEPIVPESEGFPPALNLQETQSPTTNNMTLFVFCLICLASLLAVVSFVFALIGIKRKWALRSKVRGVRDTLLLY